MPTPYTGGLITPCSDNRRAVVSIASPLDDMILLANTIAGTDSAWIYLRSDYDVRFVALSHPSIDTQEATACCLKALASEDVWITWQAQSASDGSSPAHFAGLRITDTDGRTFAALCVAAPDPLHFTAKQVQALQALGRQIARHLLDERDFPYPPTKTKGTCQGQEGDFQSQLPNPSEPGISVDDLNRTLAGFLNLVLQSAGEGIYGIDMEGRCTFTNRVAAEMLGYTEAEILGQNMHQLAHHSRPDGSPYPVEDCPINRAFKSGQGCRVSDDVFWHRNGTPFPVEYSSFPILDGGAITGAVVTVLDISDRRRSEERLRASEERYRVLFDACPAGYIKLNPSGQVEAWNPAAEAIFGWSAAEATAFSSLAFLVPDALWDDIERLANEGEKAVVSQGEDGRAGDVSVLNWRHRGADSLDSGGVSDRCRDALLARLLSNFLTYREPVASVNENITKDGRTITCEWLNIPIYDAMGNATGFLSVVQDVTQRSRAEMELRESELRFRELVENMNEVFWMSVSDFSEILYVSPAYEKIWDRSRDSLYRHPLSWTEAIHPDDQAGVLKLIQEQAHDDYDIEYRIVRPDGSIRWIHDRAFPIRNEAGVTYRLAGIAEDITDRKQAERDLIAAHANAVRAWDETTKMNAQLQQAVQKANRLRASVERENLMKSVMLAAISSILISLDGEDRIMQWNAAAEKAFGISANDVLGKSFRECSIQWNWPAVLECVETCRQSGKPLRLNDFRFTRPGGTEGILGITLTPIHADEKQKAGFLLVGADITERKFMESQLAHAQKMESIGHLAAGIAHEINTPVQYIGDNARFLQEAFQDLSVLITETTELVAACKAGIVPPESVARVKTAIEQADVDYLQEEIPKAIQQSLDGIARVTKIVQAMKDFSHPGTKEKVAIDINRAIENTLTVARNEWKYVAEVVTEFDPSLPSVPCLPDDLNQVILNLVINAAHAIAEVGSREANDKGLITIRTLLAGDWVEIRISDTGNGIPEAIRTRIFDPFFTTKEVGKGTGQGLAIAHSIMVDKHGGTIHFETEVGRGTTFILRLPLEEAQQQAGIKAA